METKSLKDWSKGEFLEWCGESIKLVCPKCKGPCKVIVFFPSVSLLNKQETFVSIICVQCEISWGGYLKFEEHKI